MEESGSTSPAEDLSVAGVVLASGMSRRFGRDNKLLSLLDGIPVGKRTVEAYVAAGLQPVLVVLGYEADLVESSLSDLPVTILQNGDFREGQSRALIRGVGGLPGEVDAAIIGVADQPYLTGAILRQLMERYKEGGVLAVVPRYAGVQRGLALFDRTLFAELLEIEGDQGGRSVLLRHRGDIGWVDIDDQMAGADVDTPEDLERLTKR